MFFSHPKNTKLMKPWKGDRLEFLFLSVVLWIRTFPVILVYHYYYYHFDELNELLLTHVLCQREKRIRCGPPVVFSLKLFSFSSSNTSLSKEVCGHFTRVLETFSAQLR